MKFKFRANDEQATKYAPASSSISFFTGQAIQAGNERMICDRPNEFFQNPSIVREAIGRELERQRIREEIVEAEVRRDMLIEREIALSREDGLSFLSGGSPSSLRQWKGEGLLAKPKTNLSGAKRKAVLPLTAASSELPWVGLNGNHKEEWTCAVCHVGVTCERSLHEHLRGKKHKAKEAKLSVTGNSVSIGLFPNKTGNPTDLIETNPCSELGDELEGKSQQVERMGTTPSLKNWNIEDMKGKNEPRVKQDADDVLNYAKEASEETQNTGHKKKKKTKLWCEICQVGVYGEPMMDTHRKGKKHVGRLEKLGSNLAGQLAEAMQKVEIVDMVTRDEGKEAMENVDGTEDGMKWENHSGVVEVTH